MSRRHLLSAAVSGLALIAASPALAQSVAYNAPNFIDTLASTSVTLGGVTYTNQGLVGTARIPATLHDFNGETLGSFSGMSIDLKSWRRAANGQYSATIYTLPDRGPNNVGGFKTTNYAARLNRFTITLDPATGTAAVPQTQQQMQMTQAGGFLLRDANGVVFTGRDPQAGVVVRNGISYPVPPAGDVGAGKIALDAEAVAFLRDGSFYIGDEYGAGLTYFDASGAQIGAIQANPDLLPRVGGVINFNGTNDMPIVAGSTGRRSNQGMEGVAVSPDGNRLFAVLQSATLQDNPTNVAVRRNNTRILVYDISQTRTPTSPMAEYVLQLPVYNNSATGTGAANATAAQSEVLALNNSQLLVLSRDGNGRGTNGNANAIAYKSILLVDIAGATNIAGTPYAGTTPISTTAAANGSGALVAGITPVQQVELVNMLNRAQLTRFGINTITAPSTKYTLSEKWEAMGLVPVLEEAHPHDFFLLVGNDNDFVSSDIDAAGVTNANTSLVSPTAGTGDNDNTFMIYRLTLPTYIDPEALAWMNEAAPYAITGARVVGAQMGSSATVTGLWNLSSLREAQYLGAEVGSFRAWGQAGLDRLAAPVAGGSIEGSSFAVGGDGGNETFRAGFSLSSGRTHNDAVQGFNVEGDSLSGAVYGGYFAPSGVYVQAAAGAGSLDLDIARPASYGLIANGEAEGDVKAFSFQVGYSAAFGDGVRAGPFVEVGYSDVNIDAYTETGAALGNASIPESAYKRTETTMGFEASYGGKDTIRPSFRLAYTDVSEKGDTEAALVLAAVPGSAGVATLPEASGYFVSVRGAVEGDWSGFGWRAAAELRSGANDERSGVFSLGLSKAF